MIIKKKNTKCVLNLRSRIYWRTVNPANNSSFNNHRTLMISQNLNITMFELNFKIRKNDYNFNRIVVIALNVVSGN